MFKIQSDPLNPIRGLVDWIWIKNLKIRSRWIEYGFTSVVDGLDMDLLL